jgi:hypothetical protein
MLNGVAPVLIINFIKKKNNSAAQFLSGIPIVGDDLAGALTGGLPIPLYLDENLTGILVKSETKTIAVETEVKGKTDGAKPKVNQRPIDSNVSINMVARKDSVVLAALLALNDQIFQKVVSQEYSISYLNGPTLIFNGLFNGMTCMGGDDDDLLHITLNISKGNQETTSPTAQNPEIAKTTGQTPIVPGGA